MNMAGSEKVYQRTFVFSWQEGGLAVLGARRENSLSWKAGRSRVCSGNCKQLDSCREGHWGLEVCSRTRRFPTESLWTHLKARFTFWPVVYKDNGEQLKVLKQGKIKIHSRKKQKQKHRNKTNSGKIQEDEPKSENYSSTSLAYFIAPGHCLMLNIFRIPPNTYLKPSFSGEGDHWLYSWTHLSYAQILLCPTTLTHPVFNRAFL